MLFRSSVVADDGHRTIRADLFIADRLKAIVHAHGRGVYESYDRDAVRLLERGRGEKNAHMLDEVFRAFPVAQAVPDALLSGHHEKIRAWRRGRAEEVTKERRPDLWQRVAKAERRGI